jgi:asparagine synthase (glutamine-hydrolysing)
MCGITGFVNLVRDGAGIPELRRMLNVISHRGPDGHGIHEDGKAFLGHRRLSIIDLSNGHQPMSNEDGSAWITFNGEVFNHASLRPDLERLGHRYSTRCDTETLIHAFEQYSHECPKYFRGMFAFAIWDANRQKLFCARDRLGIKPFYYFLNERVFAFASEIKALLQHPEITARFEEKLLAEYLTFGYVSSDETLFKGIRKLMPGHTLTLDAQTGEVQIRQYWDVPPASSDERKSDEEWIRECRMRLEEAVQTRLMSDVPLGMFLSGGVDSSAIAALIKRLRTEPVKTFAVGYREAAYSELAYARRVADAIGTDHHEVVIGMEDFFNALPRLVWHEDEPIAWPSSISLHFVSQLAAQQVKVVLTGEGSDELFAGYYRYSHYLFNRKWADRYQFVPGFVRGHVRPYIDGSRFISADLRRKLQHTFLGRDRSVESLQLDNFYGAFSADERETMLGSSSVKAANPYAGYLSYWNARQGSVLSQMLYADQKTYLVELLMKQDQMSMANSIESRVPFLDHIFVEFASRVPEHLKIQGKTGKYILKRAVEDLLPREIIYRPKMGFPTPLRQWFREKRAEPIYQLLLAPNKLLAEYIEKPFLLQLIDRQRSGMEDATDRIWRLLNLQLWGDLFLAGRQAEHWDGLLHPSMAEAVV